MLLTTMLHADEIMPADFGVPDAESAPSEKEMRMARLLIDTLSGPFEPERYPDEHRRRVLEAIEAKTPTAAPNLTHPPATRVVDLMAALEASVKAAKAARGEDDRQTKPRRRRSTA
jgi:DNA end-binding protein Ku